MNWDWLVSVDYKCFFLVIVWDLYKNFEFFLNCEVDRN